MPNCRRLVELAVVGCLAAAGSVCGALVCALTGAAAPTVATLMASTTNPATDAWLVNPDCTSETISVSGGSLNLGDRVAQRVASIPSSTQILFITGGLSSGGDFSASTTLARLFLLDSDSVSTKDLKFPGSLRHLQFAGGSVANVASLSLPDGLTALLFIDTDVTSIKGLKLPPSLDMLTLARDKVVTVDFDLPPQLSTLYLTQNSIETIDRVTLPDSLVTFDCGNCPIHSMRGVRLPTSLGAFNLGTGPMVTFEVRQSDLAILRRIQSNNMLSLTLTQTQCSDTTATIESLDAGKMCVISDERFNEQYGGGTSSTAAPSSSGTSSSSAQSPTSSSSTQNPAAGISASTTPSRGVGDVEANSTESSSGGMSPSVSTTIRGSSDGSLSSKRVGSLGLQQESPSPEASAASYSDGETDNKTSSSKATQKPGVTTTDTTSKSKFSLNSPVTIILVIVATAFVLIVGGITYRTIVGSATKKPDSSDEDFTSLESPQSTASAHPTAEEEDDRSCEYLENDIRNDKSLSLFRIDGNAVQRGDTNAKGSFGVIYSGKYSGTSVVIKQLLPGKWRDQRTVQCFMDEIRMCASMDHPKIVRCIGISWTSLRDLSVLTECMTNGDLRSLLDKQRDHEQSGEEWCEPWTLSKIKSKTSIATDIAEATVYLHSFRNPIVHRDLNANNVILDTDGNAKLSGFGISRELSEEETMTREVGTIAWTAPEVLRGERYCEKADIYSLGVLLVELDRCRHPYEHEQVLSTDDTNSRGRRHARGGAETQNALRNTRIAILVSTGKLQPTPSLSCPEGVRAIVAQCVAFDASERPTAMEVHHALRKFRKAPNP